jgi:ATP-dependent Clp protease ATP-binding subunit ClpB
MFRPLSRSNIRDIVQIQFGQIQKRLNEAGIALEISSEVLDYLGDKGFDPQFGARPLKRVIQTKLLNLLSKEILAGNISKDSIVGITLSDSGTIEFHNLNKVEIDTDI